MSSEPKKYFSKVDSATAAIFFGTILILATINLPITTFLLAAFFYTYYFYEGDFLHWRSGPFKGKIALSSIKEIRRAKSPTDISATVKPSLVWKPLVIKYNRWDDLPVSPGDEDTFIDELKAHVPDLKISI